MQRLVAVYANELRRDGCPGDVPRDRLKNFIVEVAHHEAAHAVFAVICGSYPRAITIIPDDGGPSGVPRWGYSRQCFSRMPKRAVRKMMKEHPASRRGCRRAAAGQALVSLAGPVMDEHSRGELFEFSDYDHHEDLANALSWLADVEPNGRRRERWARRLAALAGRCMARDDFQRAISSVAEQLLNTPTLTGDDLYPVLGPAESIAHGCGRRRGRRRGCPVRSRAGRSFRHPVGEIGGLDLCLST